METPKTYGAENGGYPAVSLPGEMGGGPKTLAFFCVLLALWASTHRYRGLGGDAGLYAVQALARIRSGLSHDLFLEYTSQEDFTVFSPLYAQCIALLGLHDAALTLTIIFKCWFFGAAWTLARCFAPRHVAFLAVAMLVVISGAYGAYGVFHFAEDWVTARSLAEALIITALAVYFRGSRTTGLLIAIVALPVHPLMALPGVLVLASLRSSWIVNVTGAAVVVAASLGVAFVAAHLASNAHILTVMDTDWLTIVRERSQFLFPQLWSSGDWKLTARPFLSLMISWLAIGDGGARKLCVSTMIVGGTGLAVAFIAGLVGPVSLLLQGQAWRWVWVTTFVSILLLAPTITSICRDQKVGFPCAVLIACAWTLPWLDSVLCLPGALLLLLIRERLGPGNIVCIRWVAGAGAVLLSAWAIKYSWHLASPPPLAHGRWSLPIDLLREASGVPVLCVICVWPLIYCISRSQCVPGLFAICAVLFGLWILLLPGAFYDHEFDGTPAAIEEFTDWRDVIPTTSNVFVVPAHNSASFAWFTLERPSYLTVDQSSGVVFSRATALEVRRRSQVLQPLMDPDWTLLSDMRRTPAVSHRPSSPSTLTRDLLIQLCSDPSLNFIVAREELGFQPISHTHPGQWKDWNLYDCRRVHE